jgi:hypothetical protein
MANLGTTFDASSVEPAQALEVLPAGRYRAQIVNSEMRVTKDGRGRYLWLEIDVLEGPCQGRKLYDRLNLENANAQTVDIAKRALSAICHATGRIQVQDSAELHAIPFIAVVQVQPPRNGYGESNRVRYLPIDRPVQTPLPPARYGAQKPPEMQPVRAAPLAKGPTAAPWKRPV